MARPKGVVQKRNESKYWLPLDIKLKEGQQDRYDKATKLTFVDPEFGEFISSFKALQTANSSTHPKSVQKRREATNTERYGGSNPSCDKKVRLKAQETMIKLYGVKNALENKELLQKSRDTLMSNHGVNHPMDSVEFRNKQKKTCLDKYGVENPMQSDIIKARLKDRFVDLYGYDNPAKDPQFKEKALETLTKNGTTFSSEGELELKQYIESLGFSCKNGFIGGNNPKQIDIKIENSNIAIEYNGAYWHSEANKNMYKNYHIEKMKAAKDKGLKLIQIFDFEWLERKSQIKGFLRSALGKNERVFHARKCEIKEVEKQEAKNFLEKYHILGSTNFKYCYGLYDKDELLSLITLNTHHRNNNELVLNRFVGKENCNVSGGLSKLTSYAYELHGEFSTWIDLRFSNEDNWIKAGWTLSNTLRPDYFYLNIKNGKIVSKQSRKKSKVNTPSDQTELEHAHLEGLRRIYDCGKVKLLYKRQ